MASPQIHRHRVCILETPDRNPARLEVLEDKRVFLEWIHRVRDHVRVQEIVLFQFMNQAMLVRIPARTCFLLLEFHVIVAEDFSVEQRARESGVAARIEKYSVSFPGFDTVYAVRTWFAFSV